MLWAHLMGSFHEPGSAATNLRRRYFAWSQVQLMSLNGIVHAQKRVGPPPYQVPLERRAGLVQAWPKGNVEKGHTE